MKVSGRLPWRRLRPHLLALGLYAVLTAIALDNLVWNFSTAIPGVGEWQDYALFYWDLWWVKYALFNLHRDPLFSNYVFYPHDVNLSLHTFAFTLGLLTAPLQEILNLRLIFNGLLVASFIAAGYITFLWLRRHVQNDWLAMLGGTLFAFTPTSIHRANIGHINLAQTWWLPLQLLLWENLVAQGRFRTRLMSAIALGVTVYLAWMTDVQFVLWGALLLPPYALYTWITQCHGRERARVAALTLAALAVAIGPALIEPIPAILQARELALPRAPLEAAQFYSFRLSWLVIRDPERLGDNIGQLFPLLTLVGLWLTGPRRRRWLWLVLGIGAFILALGPRLPEANIPLPYTLLHEWLDGQYRTPVRFTTPATLALTMFIILSLANGFEHKAALRQQPWLVGALMVGVVIDSDMASPFPISFMPDYKIYHEIGRDRAEYALLEVPVGAASGYAPFGRGQELQYYSFIHHKQIINGIVSRIPGDWIPHYASSPLLRGLGGHHDLPPLEEAGRELAEKLTQWDMRYVLVHRDLIESERARAIVAFLNIQPFLCLIDEEGDLLAYRRITGWADCPRPEMSALPAGTMRLALGQPGDERYIGPGWYWAENIGGPQGRWAGGIPTSTLRILLPRHDMRVSFYAWAYPPAQSVTIMVNGQQVARLPLVEAWQEYTFDIPAGILPAAGPTLIELRHAALLSAAQRTEGQSPDRRPLAAAYAWFEFTPLP